MDCLFINVNHDVGFESSESNPISLGYILAVLKKRGHRGIILDDVRDRPLRLNMLEKWLRRTRAGLVGFTAYQSTMGRIRFLCRYIKMSHPDIVIVLGGPQAVKMPSEGLEDLLDVDVLVRGEGEIVTAEIAEALDEGRDLSTVPGITCRVDGRVVDTAAPADPPEDLDEYESPYLADLINLEGKDTAIMLSSRGCSHACMFCITPAICRGKVRYHSIQRTVDEMQRLTEIGIQRFWFADPNFTEDPDRTRRLLEEKMRRGITTPFWFQTRSDLIDADLIRLLHQAGADTIAFGLESGSPGVLKKINKGIELDQVRRHVELAQSLGMDAELFTIFGLPGEGLPEVRETLDFLRSLEIPILSNSGSQQMQLYFGSVYERRSQGFGFRPISGYRPRYLSVGEDFETMWMSREDMARARNMWALANEQMERDVYLKQRIFDVLEFLIDNGDDLKDEPNYYVFGALASSVIEEWDLLVGFLEGFADLIGPDNPTVSELIGSLTFFRESEQPIEPMDRVIFDSRSWIDGVPFTGISGKYLDVLLGRGLLLESFEQGFLGARAGEQREFDFTFPQDYDQVELRGKTVDVTVKIHKVFETIRVSTVEEVKKLNISNTYALADLDMLRENNEILYALALRNTDPAELLRKPSHFLSLVHHSAKLNKREKAASLAELVKDKPTALRAVADTLTNSGKCAWAIEYYAHLAESMPSAALQQARCLFLNGDSQDALDLLESLEESSLPNYRETLLECLKRARPDSDLIPTLEEQVLDARVRAAIERERVYRASGPAEPIIHGLNESSTF